MKRRFACGFLAALCLTAAFGANAETPRMSQQDAVKAAVLIEARTGAVLWESGGDAQHSVAGLSRLPALLTLAQSMDDGSASKELSVCVSERAAAVTGPTAFLEGGENIDADALIKAAIMISAGDAITALGEAVYGSESVFADNVNVTLSQLDLPARVTDSLGTGAAFSAKELASMGAAAANSATFCKYAALYLDGITHEDGRETELVNANRLLNNYAGCGGLLTGSSQQDGYCGVFLAKRNDTTLIAAVIGADSAAIRAAAAVELLDYGFANFRFSMLAHAGQAFAENLPVRNGNIRSVNLVVSEDVHLIHDARAGAIAEQVSAPEYLEAPFSTGDPLGSVTFVTADGTELAAVPLYASAEAEAFGVKDILKKIMLLFIGL